MPTFLLKTEPSEFAFADLVATKRAAWDGVTNAAALIALRSMRKGDEALIYHTGLEKAIVGLARIATNPYEDPARPGTNDRGEPRFAVVDLAPVAAAPTPVPLARRGRGSCRASCGRARTRCSRGGTGRRAAAASCGAAP